jgi:superoxide dismutase, Cu-Zn family
MKRFFTAVALAGLGAVACAGSGPSGLSSAPPDTASFDESPTAVIANAVITDPAGKTVGLARFREARQGVRIDLKVTGFVPGTHAVQINAVGKCDPPDFASAGAPFDVNGQKHGTPGAVNAKSGDMPQLVVASDGTGALLFYSPQVSLNKAASNGLTFGKGTAVVIHANADDGKTDPDGNSGPRIACGVVKVAG